MGWELYDNPIRRARDKALSRINSQGQIWLNRYFIRTYVEEQGYTHINFRYDKQRELIGLELTSKPEYYSYAITRHALNGNGALCIRSFLNYYSISVPSTVYYEPFIDPDTKFLCIDVNKGFIQKPKPQKEKPMVNR